MEIVKMEHVTKIYGEGNTRVWALDDVNLTVNKGEIVAVVGAEAYILGQNVIFFGVFGIAVLDV